MATFMAGSDGWSNVASGLLPAIIRGRGRPRKPADVITSFGAPEVPCQTVADLPRLFRDGHGVLSQMGSFLQRRLWSALRDCKGHERRLEDNPAKFLLQRMPVLSISGQSALTDRSGPQQTLARDERRVGCCGLLFSGHLSGWLLNKCQRFATTASGWKLLGVLKRRRYDETPTKIAVRETAETTDFGKPRAKAEVAKVFQTEFSLGLLMANTSQKRCCLLRLTLPTMMSCVDAATAENIKQVQCEAENLVAGLAEVTSKADFVFNLPCTD